jgi:hypothetical protein
MGRDPLNFLLLAFMLHVLLALMATHPLHFIS